MPQKEWFATWFDSPYYHLLYQHRDDNEAKLFLDHLVQKLALPNTARILDLACGKGRHSLTLAQMGFEVVGADLAPNSISAAQEQAEKLGVKNVEFCVHDMRQAMETSPFDAVFNLFTSFGYFEALADNHKVCASIATMLAPNGIVVIDFFNAQKVSQNLVAEESVSRGDINFEIKRWASDTHIFKQISIQDPQHDQTIGPYTERVQALSLSDFQELLEPSFDLLNTYGSYDLAPFNPENSDRLILIAKKKP